MNINRYKLYLHKPVLRQLWRARRVPAHHGDDDDDDDDDDQYDDARYYDDDDEKVGSPSD